MSHPPVTEAWSIPKILPFRWLFITFTDVSMGFIDVLHVFVIDVYRCSIVFTDF